MKASFFIFGSFLCEGFLQLRRAGGHSSSRCVGLSLSRPLLLQSTGSRRAGSVVVAHGPSCSAACGILPDQGSNPCPPHWQADSQPLHYQGSPNLRNLTYWSLVFFSTHLLIWKTTTIKKTPPLIQPLSDCSHPLFGRESLQEKFWRNPWNFSVVNLMLANFTASILYRID